MPGPFLPMFGGQRLPELSNVSVTPVESGEVDWDRYYGALAMGFWEDFYNNNPGIVPMGGIDFGNDLQVGAIDYSSPPYVPPSSGSIFPTVVQAGLDLAGMLIGGSTAPATAPFVAPVGSPVPAGIPAGGYEQTPNAGILTGACPPGRVRRRVAFGRDKCIKKPHMNVLNPKALSRSTRRVSGFLNRVKSVEKQIKHAMAGTGVITSGRRSTRKSTGCYSCGRAARSCTCG